MAASISRTDLVVLVPGLWMPAWVMLPLAWRLRSRGLRSACFGYPSKTRSLEENADRLAGFVRSLGDGRVHLVGHSLGGVLALHATASKRLARVSSIVTIGSPARGSYAADRLSERKWGRRLLGHTVRDWQAAPRPAAPEAVPVGVIAGTRAFGLGMIFVPDLERPHDGVVRAAETLVTGASAHAAIPAAHAALLTSGHVAALVAAFVRQGSFDRAGGVSADAPLSRPVPQASGKGHPR